MEHHAAYSSQIVNNAKSLRLVGDVFGGAGIDHEVKLLAQMLRDLIVIQVERDAVAVTVQIYRRVFEANRGPEGP